MLKNRKIALLAPNQVIHEYIRNSEEYLLNHDKNTSKEKALDSISKLKEIAEKHFSKPTLIKKKLKAVEKDIQKQFAQEESRLMKGRRKAHALIMKVLEKKEPLCESEETYKKAGFRYLKGDPPKTNNGCAGDAIIWEFLLETEQVKEVSIITGDTDFILKQENTLKLHSLLEYEWKQLKKGKLHVYDNLSVFINTLEKKPVISKDTIDQEKSDDIHNILSLQNSTFNSKANEYWENIINKNYIDPDLYNPQKDWEIYERIFPYDSIDDHRQANKAIEETYHDIHTLNKSMRLSDIHGFLLDMYNLKKSIEDNRTNDKRKKSD